MFNKLVLNSIHSIRYVVALPLLFIAAINLSAQHSIIVSHIIDPTHGELQFFWKDEQGQNYLNFDKLRNKLAQQGDTLLFATNGGMYNKSLSPQGLYIEKSRQLAPLDTASIGFGNFYMKPNGVFFIRANNSAGICITESFKAEEELLYATQSGPMLLINGNIHHRFNKGSANVNIRNGVGLLPNGCLLFAMSKGPINFYDFASYFKDMGCQNALYLDGFVSRTYLPAHKCIQLDGSFAVIIAQVKRGNNK